MQTVHTPLFSGITDEQQQRMLVCFGVREESFLPEDLIYDFNDRRNIIGLIISGTARVERVDERGVRTILEHLERESVFGEMLMFDNIAGDSLTVVCEKDCRVWFIPADHLVHPCENACAHHSQMIQNMFRLVAEKASALSERVEVLSRRSIRDKLLCYFAIQAGRCRRVLHHTLFAQHARRLYLRRPQRHDARAEKDARGGACGGARTAGLRVAIIFLSAREFFLKENHIFTNFD